MNVAVKLEGLEGFTQFCPRLYFYCCEFLIKETVHWFDIKAPIY